MIKLTKYGTHKLIETKRNTKILYLDKDSYAWIEPTYIGEILVISHQIHKTDCLLSFGEYRLYTVSDEPNLTDQWHLELEVGKNVWQGYILLSGLPHDQKKRVRIIPTKEVISANPRYHKLKQINNIAAAAEGVRI